MGEGTDDLLRPDESSSFRVSTRSRSTWHALLSSARSMTHLPYSCCNIKSLLNGTPSIPNAAQVTESIEKSSMCLEGFSQWTISSNNSSSRSECDLPSTKRALPRKVYIGESRPGTCRLSNDSFTGWPGLQSLPSPAENLLAPFVLGWSYVFSTRLIELRQRTASDKVIYTEDMAQCSFQHDINDAGHFNLEIRTGRIAEVRWWAAMLASGPGWQATLTRQDRAFFPPWECHLDSSPFRICHHAELSDAMPNLGPPSSEKAQEYLLNLARQYDAFDQLICALAATLTLPMHNRFGASIALPKPSKGSSASRLSELTYSDQIPTFADIPHYMALSGTSGLLPSCLFGGFWEPGIPCNLTSQWLEPAMKEIAASLSQSKHPFAVIWAMSERRPNLASLWLGAAITGLLPRILQVPRSFIPTIYLEGVVWTTSPQSFMDPSNHRCVKTREMGERIMISREDEFRLLFLTDARSDMYGNPPICPYSPFGEVDVQQSSLEVRLHLCCNHKLSYHSWAWQCQNGNVLDDHGSPTISNSSKTVFRSYLLSALWISSGIAWMNLSKSFQWNPSLMQQAKQQNIGVLFPCTLAMVCLLQKSVKVSMYKSLLTVGTWIVRAIAMATSIVRPSSQQYEEDGISNERLSELATRNLFSWTFFNEGIRTEDRSLWKHEWLEMLIDRNNDVDSSESSSSGSKYEGKFSAFENVVEWQEDVFVQAVADIECGFDQ